MQFADEHGIMIIDECALSQTNVAIEYVVPFSKVSQLSRC